MKEQAQKHDSTECSLDSPEVRAVLDRLHRNARGDIVRFPGMGLSMLLDKLLGREPTVAEQADRMKDIYIPISRKQGVFAYLVARSIGASRIVEFGTSFGISIIYLAAAVKDNGGGLVIGSEIEETKLAKARQHLEEAGLERYADVRPGDAQQSLADPGGVVDMVLLDGWKDLYLPIVKMLTPRLRPGSVVLADNIYTFRKSLAPYVTHMRDARNGFQSITVPFKDGFEYSVRLSE